MKIHSKSTKRLLCYCIVFAVALFGAGLTTYLASRNSTTAVSATDFKAGYIVSDYVFYNKNSMNAQQIQDFLNRLIPVCQTWKNTIFTEADGQRVGPPFVCLNNYHENPSTGETSFERGGGAFAGGISAAQIIYDAAQKYNINPQVLLVMLRKESSGPLTRDNWPTKKQYRYAMGYACPDSGPNNTANCNSQKAGFYKQVNLAAWRLKYYRDHPNDYRYKIGWNDIQYSPNIACGTKRVYIENIATLSLYIYTPYTPNDAALANYPGTAPCGAYGNRNFFMFFSEWFGSTQDNGFKPLDMSRWMKIKKEVSKVNIYSKKETGQVFSVGTQLRFVDKISIDGSLYLRTAYDSAHGSTDVIPFDAVSDIPYEAIEAKWITMKERGNKSIPSSRTNNYQYLDRGTSIKVVEKITVDNNTYYRTEYDKKNNINAGINSIFVTDFSAIPLDNPRYFCSASGIDRINPLTNTLARSPSDLYLLITKKTKINDVWYFQARNDEGTENYIDSRKIKEVCYYPLETPRSMILNVDTNKISPYSYQIQGSFKKGTVIPLASKIFIKETWYYRTVYDTNKRIDSVMPANAFVEL